MDRRLLWFLGLLAPVLAWSWHAPHDRFTWWLEVTPALAGVPVIVIVRRRFPLSALLLALLWLHCVVLMVGGHYTYELVPGFAPGDGLGRFFGWTRNNYDKLGHFAQGFVPAVLTREILLRTSPLGPDVRGGRTASRWLPFLVVSVCLAFSALYELIEWRTALSQGAAADAFLGTQGDVWDTQEDMAMALIGAVVAVATMGRWHDRSLANVLAPGGAVRIR
jgi:putative membrane protein